MNFEATFLNSFFTREGAGLCGAGLDFFTGFLVDVDFFTSFVGELLADLAGFFSCETFFARVFFGDFSGDCKRGMRTSFFDSVITGS